MIDIAQKPLSGKKGLVLGIANEHSLAYGCAKAFRAFGAELAITYSRNKAKPYVEPLARALEASDLPAVATSRARSARSAVFQAIEHRLGQRSILRSTPSPLRRRRTCMAGSPTARATGSFWRWTSRATPSYAWRDLAEPLMRERRRSFHDELLRRREGHRALQRDGPRQGRVGKRRTLSRL